MGNVVEARHGGGRKWFPGKISAVNEDGTFDVAYDDGDKESGIEAKLIKRASQASQASGKGASRSATTTDNSTAAQSLSGAASQG